MDQMVIASLVRALAPVVADHVRMAIQPLMVRLQALESRPLLPGEPGDPGVSGPGFVDALIDADKQLCLTRTDGSLQRLGQVVGHDGADGRAGVGISSIDLVERDITFRLTDGQLHRLGPIVGKDGDRGAAGEPGVAGRDGRSIVETIQIDGSLLLAFSDNTEAVVGPFTGPPGPVGEPGPPGEAIRGEAGPPGADGRSVERLERSIDGRLLVGFSDNTEIDLGSFVGPAGRDGRDADIAAVQASVADAVQKAVAELPPPERGEQGPPGPKGEDADLALIETRIAETVQRAIAELPPPRDGQDVDSETVRSMVLDEVAKAIALIPPRDGQDVDPAHVEALVDDAVTRAIGAIPPPRDGQDADPEQTRALVAQAVADAVAALPAPQDGASVTVEDMAPLVRETVAAEVAAIPKPQDGRDGLDMDPGLVQASIAAEVQRQVDALPRAQDGKDGLQGPPGEPGPPGENADPVVIRSLIEQVEAQREEIRLLREAPALSFEDVIPLVRDAVAQEAGELYRTVETEIAKQVAALPKPKDGIGLATAMKDADGNLILVTTDGSLHPVGHVDGAPGRDGQDGRDGLGIDDLTVLFDGERSFELSAIRGDQVKNLGKFSIPALLDRGVWRDGSTYERGDAVTFGGSVWIAQETTTKKPGDGSGTGWRLSVKSGRAGRSAYDVARSLGYSGSEREWIQSLRGKDGRDGKDGAPGRNGGFGS